VLPALFLPLGARAALFVLINSILAELITNVHEFCVIGPNHTGDDLYRFDEPIKDKSEFFARQVLGSVNYTCGSDAVDYPQSWLNYQIEHHLYPDIPMLKYQQYHQRVRALCEQYGITYRKEPLARRVRKLVSVMIGDTSMLRIDSLSRTGSPLQPRRGARENAESQADPELDAEAIAAAV
jgi:fatty acid desaturase